MNIWCLCCIALLSYAFVDCEDDGIKSKSFAEDSKWTRCPYSVKKLWHVEVSSFPFSAPPLVTDVDGDGGMDVVVAPFAETVTVIEGESGKHLHGSNWPQQNLDKSVFSSPLQFDIDGDGTLDILVVTSSGGGLFYTKTGISLLNFSFALSPVYVQASWFKEKASADHNTISQYVSTHKVAGTIPVEPHVLSSPVLYGMRHLILPVSYYYRSDDTPSDPLEEKPRGKEDKSYITAIAVLDLLEFRSIRLEKSDSGAALSYLKTYFLELQKNPVFGLFTPTVCDLDGDFGEPEIIHGSTSGHLFVLGMTSGQHRDGFPLDLGSISGRVSVVDTDRDGSLELVVLTTSGTVTKIDSRTGAAIWRAEIEGSSFSGSQAVDVDMDGQLDIVVATNYGGVYALHGANGSVVPKYPYQAEAGISGNILITKFSKRQGGPLDLVFLSDDGILHILPSDQSCVSKVALEDKSLVDILSSDIVVMNGGLELVVATADGSVVCLGSGREVLPQELVDKEVRLAQRSFHHPRNHAALNDFTASSHKTSIVIEDSTRTLKEVTGNSFYVDISVHTVSPTNKYNIRVYLGSDVVYQIDRIAATLIPTSLKLHTPDEPKEGQITVVLIDQHGLAYTDSIFLRFNQLILLDLQWLVVTPLIAMVIILLVNHGFPAKDLLPVTFPFKSK